MNKMDVSYTKTTKKKLNTIPKAHGQIISVIDVDTEDNAIYQDFLDEESEAVIRHKMSSSSGGSRAIKDSSGITMPTRASVRFNNATVTDDETNDETVITPSGGSKGSAVVVNAPDSSYNGKTVTLTDGTTTLTATFNNSGVATFADVPSVGMYTVSSNNGSTDAAQHIAIPYFGQYEVTLTTWKAIVNLKTSSEEFYNLEVIIRNSDGEAIGSATFSSAGTATWVAYEADKYTFEVNY